MYNRYFIESVQICKESNAKKVLDICRKLFGIHCKNGRLIIGLKPRHNSN